MEKREMGQEDRDRVFFWVVGAIYIKNAQEHGHWKGDIWGRLEGDASASHVVI